MIEASAGDDRLVRWGPVLAALTAVVAGAPSLVLPFVSDDWVHLWAADRDVLLHNPFEFFRPLCSLTYWVEWRLWGLRPAPYHAANVALAALAAGLVTRVARRYAGDAAVGLLAGLLFALHPYHVGPVSWISARSDLLSACLVLAGLLAYDRWRERAVGLPLGTFALYELAMLAKETGVVLPGAIVVVGLLDRQRRASRTEWLRGYVPLGAIALAHFLLLRSSAMGAPSLNHLKWIAGWRDSLLSYGVTSVVAPPLELFQRDVRLWAGVAALFVGVLVAACLVRARRLPAVIWPAAAAFVALLGPALIGFQARYFFLPGAASALALAALLRGAGPRWATVPGAALLAVWLWSAVEGWSGQLEAGRAGAHLMGGLVEASREVPGGELIAIGIPHRVRGVPVTTDYTRVLPFLGGGAVDVRSAGEFDFPRARNDARGAPRPVEVRPEAVTLHLSVPERPYSRRVLPRAGTERGSRSSARIEETGPHALRIIVSAADVERSWIWWEGDLRPLGEVAGSPGG